MAELSKIIAKIENFAPPSLATEWDNSGWQIFLGNSEIQRILLAVTPTINVIEQAIEQKYELIITHHPLIFSKINKIESNNFSNLPIIKAIQNNIQVYSAHTNLDAANGGIADTLAKLVGLKNIQPFEIFARIGELEKEENLDEFLLFLKKILKIENIKFINQNAKAKIKKIAVCPGSGGDFIDKLKDIDLYLTSDIRYHDAIESNDMVIVDAGHFETERIILPILKDLLQEFDLDILIAREISPCQMF